MISGIATKHPIETMERMIPKRAMRAPTRGENRLALSQISNDQKTAVTAIAGSRDVGSLMQAMVRTITRTPSRAPRIVLQVLARLLGRGTVVPHQAQI